MCKRHLNVRTGGAYQNFTIDEKKLCQRAVLLAISGLFCSHSLSFDSFSKLSTEKRNFLLDLKKD